MKRQIIRLWWMLEDKSSGFVAVECNGVRKFFVSWMDSLGCFEEVIFEQR